MAFPARDLCTPLCRHVLLDDALTRREEAIMYPIFRILFHSLRARKQEKIGLWDTHVSHHICLPWDIDLWMELNNGRTLTLFDIGRVSMGERNGTNSVAKAHKFGMAMAGATVRYRKRVTMFQKLEMRTRAIGYDDKFLYMEQSMWDEAGDCCNHLLIRAAFLKKRKMVPPQQFVDLCAPQMTSPELPQWAQAWVEADALRPWPPEKG